MRENPQGVPGNYEVSTVCSEIDERAGPRSTVIIAIVTSDSQNDIRRACVNIGYSPGVVFIETEHSFPSRIRTLSGTILDRNRLCLIVSPQIPSINLNIPSQFRRLEIVACTKAPSLLNFVTTQPAKELILEEGSKFCNIPLAAWNARSTFLEQELVTGPGVAIDLPDQSMLGGEYQAPPFNLTKEDEVIDAARIVEEKVNLEDATPPSKSAKETLPWLAGMTGAISGMGTAGAFLVSSVKVSAYGLFVSAGPYAAGWQAVTASASLAVAGGAVGTGMAVGAAVTAAVYFIPWEKLASWLFDAFDRFIEFLKSIWRKVVQKLDFLKTILSAVLKVIKAAASGVASFASRLFNGSNSTQKGPIKLV